MPKMFEFLAPFSWQLRSVLVFHVSICCWMWSVCLSTYSRTCTYVNLCACSDKRTRSAVRSGLPASLTQDIPFPVVVAWLVSFQGVPRRPLPAPQNSSGITEAHSLSNFYLVRSSNSGKHFCPQPSFKPVFWYLNLGDVWVCFNNLSLTLSSPLK